MVQICLRIPDETAEKMKQLSWQQSISLNRRVTQGDLVRMAVDSLERELSKKA
jgi:hypothetical protein